MRQFNMIVSLIDTLNEAFGTAILTSALGGGTYFSLNIFQAFRESDEHLRRTVAVGCFVWFLTFLTAGALVHSKAEKVAKIINRRFQAEQSWSMCNGSMETTQGMILILHSLQRNEVGLQGRQFFTLTFPFVGTVRKLAHFNTFLPSFSVFDGNDVVVIAGAQCHLNLCHYCDPISAVRGFIAN